MSLEPLLLAPPAIQIHATAALFSLLWGALILLLPKGSKRHRLMGRIWALAMAVTAGSSLFIPRFGVLTPIHIFTLIVAVSLPLSIRAIRAGKVARHARGMIRLYLGATVLAGAFALAPGRLMHDVVFGARLSYVYHASLHEEEGGK